MERINDNFTLEVRDEKYYLLSVADNAYGYVLDKHCADFLLSLKNGTEFTGNLSNIVKKALTNIFDSLGIYSADVATETAQELDVDIDNEFISIVILNYNGKEHIKECIDSILDQNYGECEIIVVDNVSTDDSIEIIKNRYKSIDKVKLIRLKKGVSFSEGNNIGIGKARGEHILVINNDTKIHKDALHEIAKEIHRRRNEKWGAMALKLHFYYTPGVINSFGNSVKRRNWGYDNFLGFIDLGQFDHVKQVFSACFGAVVIKKSVHNEIGKLDSSFWFYYEDVDWSYRAQLAGYDIVTCPRAIVYHKFSASSDKRGMSYKIQLAIRNRMYFVFKNLAPYLTWKFFINYFQEDGRNLLRSIIKKDFLMTKAYIIAYLGLIFKIPVAIYKRMKIVNKIKEKNKNVNEINIHRLTQKHTSPACFLKDNYVIIDLPTLRRYYMKNFE